MVSNNCYQNKNQNKIIKMISYQTVKILVAILNLYKLNLH